ncbi:hypothetical protein LTR08_004482 [Meristemomyces frigidus]|nr:hypothetical protein LTR08_004482 [Meristemomyces frigidus]
MASPSAHTQASLCLETSRSLSHARTFSHSAASSSSSALASLTPSSSPFLLTLRIVRLVNTFRKRETARVHARRPNKSPATKDRRTYCRDFERQAFAEIDKYLGRNAVQRRYRETSAIELPLPAAIRTEDTFAPAKSIDWLLHILNISVACDDQTLASVAKNDGLFLNRKADFHIKRLSLKELTQLLLTTKDLLETLQRASPVSGAHTLCEGNEILDVGLDELYAANLEHLLYCLQDQLLRALVLHCVVLVHLHVLECQTDQQKHCEEWFFEWPDTRHPLSTTWPWSIRPSLAVIWGVCWMFYHFGNFDSEGNMVDLNGFIEVPRAAVQQYVHGMQQASYSDANIFANIMDSRHPMPGPRPRPEARISAIPAHPHSHLDQLSQTSPPRLVRTSAGDQLASQGTNNNAYGAAPPFASASANLHSGWLPQENLTLDSVLVPDPYVRINSAAHCWQLPPHSSVSAEQQTDYDLLALPPRAQNALTPRIRPNTDFSSGAHLSVQIPQDSRFYSACTNSSLPVRDNSFDHFYTPYMDTRGLMAQIPQDNAQAPVSPISAHSLDDNATLPELLSRKRSHSVMRGEPATATLPPLPFPPPRQIEQRSRANSITSQVPKSASPTGEDYSPRGSRSFKRGEPPHNHNNKYICDFDPACAGQTFDRKCEWSKHMDKHDRPYRCNNPDCAKLQGFTYSGGLLRHEREVHGKHGGPKAQLMCPHDDCKRHSGKGFTRKENLNEHIRRVHDNKPEPSQQQASQQQTSQFDYGPDYGPELQEAATGAEQTVIEQVVEPPVARMYSDINIEELAPQPTMEPLLGKRKRDDDESSPSMDVEELRQEIKRLREDNASKDDRLRRMEIAEALRESQFHRLQHTVDGLQLSQQGGLGGTGGQGEHLLHNPSQQADLGGHSEHFQHDHSQQAGLSGPLEHYQHEPSQLPVMGGQGEQFPHHQKAGLDELAGQSEQFSQDQQIRV